MIKKQKCLPLIAALAVTLSFISLILLIDSTETQQHQLLEQSAYRGLERGLTREQNTLAAVARDFAWWDDTIVNTILSPDPAWTRQNLGVYLHQNFKIDYVAVLTPEYLPRYQYNEGAVFNRPLVLSPALEALLKQTTDSPQMSLEEGPTAIHGVVAVHDQIMLASAVRLTQEGSELDPVTFENHILLVAKRLQGPLLAQLRYDLNLDALSVAPADDHAHEGSSLTLYNFTGQPVTHLHMTVPMPESQTNAALHFALVILGISALLTLGIAFRTVSTLKEKQLANERLSDEIAVRQRTQQQLYELQEQLRADVDKRTQQLYEERGRLLSIFNASADGIITITGQGVIDTVNPAAATMFGYSRDELIGQRVEMLLRPDDRHSHQGYVEGSQLHAPRIINKARQLWAKHKDGHAFPIDLNVAPIHGKERRFVGIMRDISERVELEEAREQAMSELRNVLDTAAEGYVRVSNQGDIVELNEAFGLMLGRTREQLIHKPLRALIHPDSLQEFDQQMASRHTNLQRRYELKLQTATGQGHFALKATTIMGDTGEPEGSFAFVSDMTDIHQYQHALLKARDEAERANQAKSDFLSSMSHELRTPLNAILGFAQLMSNSRREPLSQRQQTQMKHILKGGQHLLTLINEVLDLARIEAGRITLSLETVNPLPVIQESISLIEGLAAEKQITLLSPDMGQSVPLVRADQTRFKQTLINLINNAIKYNHTGGTVELTIAAENGFLRFNVRDTGIGIPTELQNQIFKPFSRLGNEGSEIEGTGIGLTITRQLVELMNGEIGFESAEGQGSTFWFSLPIENNLSASSQTGTNDPAATLSSAFITATSQRILYVEDNPANQQLMQQMLDDLGDYHLTLCHNAELGIEIAMQQRPELILMDINLPGMSGLDAISQLQANPYTQAIPVIAVSADAMDSTRRKAVKAGFVDYLTKPVSLNEIATTLQRHLPGQSKRHTEDAESSQV